MTTQRRQQKKWARRTVRLHRQVRDLVTQPALKSRQWDSAKYWQLRGNVIGTRVLQLGDSIRGRNNR